MKTLPHPHSFLMHGPQTGGHVDKNVLFRTLLERYKSLRKHPRAMLNAHLKAFESWSQFTCSCSCWNTESELLSVLSCPFHVTHHMSRTFHGGRAAYTVQRSGTCTVIARHFLWTFLLSACQLPVR